MAESAKLQMNLKRYIFFIVVFLFIWAFVYLPILYSIRHPQLEASWMLQQHDLPQYIQPNNETNLLNPKDICEPYYGKKILNLVIVICSSIPNTLARKAIRDTWGKYATRQYGVKYYFLTGRAMDETLNTKVAVENAEYGDIIQENFLDTYNNLTLKTVMMLKWVNTRCQQTKFILKSDDDVFVNVPNLISYLNTVNDTKKDNLLAGCLIKKAEPVRDQESKWYTPNSVYNGKYYPEYLSGTGYVMSRSLVEPLYKTALETQFFYLEDIFLTGMCAEKLNIERIDNEGFKFIKRKNDPCIFRTLITAHQMSPKEFYTIWKKMLQKKLKCNAPVAKKLKKAKKKTVINI